MTIAPGYPASGTKKVNELRSCKGCNLTVMAKGDWHGWKGIDVGGSQMHWFCDKTPCRQLRDETIVRRSQELLIEQSRNQAQAAENTELAALRKRVADLEAQSRPGQDPLTQDLLSEAGFGSSEQASAPVATHVVNAAGGSLCGLAGPTVKAIEMTWDHNPCQPCIVKWQAIAAGTDRDASVTAMVVPPGQEEVVTVPSSTGKGSYQVTHSSAGWSCQCEGYKHRGECKHIETAVAAKKVAAESAAQPPATASAMSALYGERPKPKPLSELPQFTPQLITAACDAPDKFIGRPILVPPEAYPELDMASLDPEKLRGGVSGLFRAAGLVVDRIETARDGNRVAGVVFTLKRP